MMNTFGLWFAFSHIQHVARHRMCRILQLQLPVIALIVKKTVNILMYIKPQLLQLLSNINTYYIHNCALDPFTLHNKPKRNNLCWHLSAGFGLQQKQNRYKNVNYTSLQLKRNKKTYYAKISASIVLCKALNDNIFLLLAPRKHSF